MSTTSSTSVQDWDPLELLEIINPTKLPFSCVGYAKTQHRRCRNRIAQHNITSAKNILRGLPQICADGAELRRRLRDLASLALCISLHQDQRNQIAEQWYRTIKKEVARRGGSIYEGNLPDDQSSANSDHDTATSTQGTLDVMEEMMRRMRRELEELRERVESDRQSRSDSRNSSSRAPSSSPTSSSQNSYPRTDKDHQEDTGPGGASTSGPDRASSTSSRRSDNMNSTAGRCPQPDPSSPRRRMANSDDSLSQVDEDRRREEARQQREEEQRRREEAQQQAEARRQEARRQAERDRAERKEAARLRAEKEQSRQQREEAARQAREQQARERTERERQSWEEAWERYERDWANMARMDTSTLDEDVLESLPWPVKEGRWQEVNERYIEEFFRHAPDGAFDDQRRFLRMLRQQSLRWHTDRIMYRFPRVTGREDVRGLTTTVMQVIVRLMDRARLQ